MPENRMISNVAAIAINLNRVVISIYHRKFVQPPYEADDAYHKAKAHHQQHKENRVINKFTDHLNSLVYGKMTAAYSHA